MSDVADTLGISVAAAKSRWLRARSELRARDGEALRSHQSGSALGISILPKMWRRLSVACRAERHFGLSRRFDIRLRAHATMRQVMLGLCPTP
jgi:hypothetical protein